MNKTGFKNTIIGNVAVGLHITITNDNSLICTYIKLCKKKDEIIIDDSQINVSLESVIPKFSKKYPILLSIDGKGVITKSVKTDSNEISDSVLQKVLPNAKSTDFYFQYVIGNNNETILSVARKEVIDIILKSLQEHNCFVYRLGIGFLNICAGLAYIQDNELSFSNWHITKSDSKIESYKKIENNTEPVTYSIGDEKISAHVILPYISALSYYSGIDNVGNVQTLSHGYTEEFYYASLIRKGAIVLTTGIFVLLIINYLLFDNYYNNRQMLDRQLMTNEMQIKKLEQIQNELTSKKKILSTMGSTGNSRFSYYADRIALLLPSKIKLTKMDIAPLASRIKKEKAISVTPGVIIISGTSPTSTDLNKWIEILRSESWLENVIISNFMLNNELNTGEFEIKLIIRSNKSVEKQNI